MQGVIEPLIFIFAFPEAVERFYYEHGISEGDDPEFDCKISDQFGTLCTFITSLSCLLSPFIGSLTYQAVEYRRTMDFNMFAFLILAVIYFTFNCGFYYISEYKVIMDALYNKKDVDKHTAKSSKSYRSISASQQGLSFNKSLNRSFKF